MSIDSRKINIGILGSSSLLGDSLNIIPFDFRRASLNLYKHTTDLDYLKIPASFFTSIEDFLSATDVLVSFIPIWMLEAILEKYSNHIISIRKVIVMSSTSAMTKIDSTNNWEREYAQRFLSSENAICSILEPMNINHIILRPTMIWGNCRDSNISFLQKFICKYGFCILPAKGTGERWPIHYTDLFSICIDLCFTERTGTYVVVGPSNMTYYELVSSIFKWHKLNPSIIILPSFLVRFVASCASIILSKPYINSSSFGRIDKTEHSIKCYPRRIIGKHSFTPFSPHDLFVPSSLSKNLNKLLSSLFN